MAPESKTPTPSNRMAVAALVLGIATPLAQVGAQLLGPDPDLGAFGVALGFLAIVLGFLAIVLGVLSWRRLRRGGSTAAKVMAIVGIVMGAYPVAIFGLLAFLYSFE